jgi:hypothetical protein
MRGARSQHKSSSCVLKHTWSAQRIEMKMECLKPATQRAD